MLLHPSPSDFKRQERRLLKQSRLLSWSYRVREMSTSRDSQEPGTSKLKRSRNGCNECRRLHRRCDEEKPACLNCREAGKACSYQRPLSWGGRPFRKSTFGYALESGVVEIPIVDSEDDARKTSETLLVSCC